MFVQQEVDWGAIKSHLEERQPVCVYDFGDREGETDLAAVGYPPSPETVHFMLRNGGGIFVAYLTQQFFDRLGMVPLYQYYQTTESLPPIYQRLARSQHGHEIEPRFIANFDLYVHPFGTKTPREISQLCTFLYDIFRRSTTMTDDQLKREFAETFVEGGSVPIISGSERLLEQRRGHTELLLSIAQSLDLPQIAFTVEMMSPTSLESMNREEAHGFALAHRLQFVTGDDVLTMVGLQ